MTTSVNLLSAMARLNLWLIGVSFVLFQFFLQLSSGVIIGSIMLEMKLSALTAGLLSSSFYFIYTSLQIPVGMLFDSQRPRQLLALNALICSIGCLVFAKSTSLFGLFLGRTLMGAGSAFAFVGLSHLLRQHYPINRFAFMIGLSETLGFIATAIGLFGMGKFIEHWGWRILIEYAALCGTLIAYLCWKYIPDTSTTSLTLHHKHQALSILSNGKLWLNGLFVGLSFTVVTVFGALWAVPFIQLKLACTLQQATNSVAAFFLGTAVSCPLFGVLANHVQSRKTLILVSCLATAFLLITDIYLPTKSLSLLTGLLFLTGMLCGAYMLAYSISNELAPPSLQSTATGFTNTLAVLLTPILQTLVGYLLDVLNHSSPQTLVSYQQALLVIPLSLLVASSLVLFLPERSLPENAKVHSS